MGAETHHLVVLARDESQEARGRLLVLLSEELLPGDGKADHELDIFYEISRSLLGKVSAAVRRAFSEAVADGATCPHDILLSLANDEIGIAEPVLVRAVRLDEADLVDIATRLTGDHRAAIALRPVLTRGTTRALLRRGEREVVLRLGANRGAEMDDDALRLLHRLAARDAGLRDVLSARWDLHPVFARLSEEARRAAPSRDPTEDRDEVTARVSLVRAGKTTLGAVVAELADADRQADLAAFLGRLAGIGESDAMRVLIRRDVDGVATLAGGLGVEPDGFARIVDLRRRKLALSETQVRWERQAYVDLDRDQARATLEQVGRHRRAAG